MFSGKMECIPGRYLLCLFMISMMLVCGNAFAQPQKEKLYNPGDDASMEIKMKVKEARGEGKHVLIQVGNNGCAWCYRFHDFVSKDKELDSVMRSNYVMYHLNCSPENPNDQLMTKYRFPQRLGYPVFLVLDGKGDLIHTQNSVYLEQGIGYNRERVMEFFNQWSPQAIAPSRYKSH